MAQPYPVFHSTRRCQSLGKIFIRIAQIDGHQMTTYLLHRVSSMVQNHHQMIRIHHYLEFIMRHLRKVVLIIILLIPVRCTLFKRSKCQDIHILVLIIFRFRKWNAKQIHEYGGNKSLRAQFIFYGVWYTLVSLTILLISVYLLLMALKTHSTGSTTNAGNFLQLQNLFSYGLLASDYLLSNPN